ncbi:MAG: hypothetical protein ACREUV_10715 [Burkholderiales bacterium]
MKIFDGKSPQTWARVIALRISDEWSWKEDFPEDAELMRKVLQKCLAKCPREMGRLIGTGVIEEDYFEPIQ